MKQRLTILSAAILFVTAAALVPMTATTSVAKKDLGKKYVFDNVTFPDGTTGTIFASIRSTKQKMMAVASYFDANDGYMGQYREHGGFASENPDEIRAWALGHFEDRK